MRKKEATGWRRKKLKGGRNRKKELGREREGKGSIRSKKDEKEGERGIRREK